MTTVPGPHRFQQTIAHPTQVTGFGFWSSQDVSVEFRPAPENSGIVFVRRDLDPVVRIPATVKHRIESPRRTTLAYRSTQVQMVEHVMAALAGLQIDNCEVWVDQPEIPGVDGSSLPFVEALRDAGVVPQKAPRPFLVVSDITRVGDDDCWIEARPVRDRSMSIQYRLDFGNDHPIGRETMRLAITPSRFVRDLAPARTFIMQHEAEWLRQQGLAQRVTTQDVLVFDDHGVMENELRFENECVAHKVLDMVGDLALAGCDLIGQFVAQRSGHRLNAQLVQALLAEYQILDDWRAIA
jgi:UDP-3-O-acyl N-acetylglucosamine deacetylase